MSYSIEQRDNDVLNSSAFIRYELDFSRAPQHLVLVTMVVEGIDADETVLRMPVWTPGSYKVRDYSAHQGNLAVFTGGNGNRKALRFVWQDKASIVIDTKNINRIEVEYLVYGNERSVRTNHINRNHAFIVPAATFMYVDGRQQEMHHVKLTNNTHVWSAVSTALSPVTTTAQETTYGAINYDVLIDSPLELGNHQIEVFQSHGATHEVAVYSTQPVDGKWLSAQVQQIVATEAEMFGGVPYDRYVFIVHVYPGGQGGLEHARSSVNAVDPKTFLDKGEAKKLLSLLCHEYFHTWNIKRIRPVELGPFNYQQEVYTTMLWLAEGLTSYYDDLLHYRCGFAQEKEYLATLAKEHIQKLMRVPGRFALSVRNSSFLSWVKLYQAGPDGMNRFPSYYLAGGVVMLLLDLHIIAHTEGRRSLDDVLRAFWERYQENPAEGMTEIETIAIIERSTGVQIRDLLLSWLDGTKELPIAEMLATVGCILKVDILKAEQISFGENRDFAVVPAEVFVGWTHSDRNGKVVVATIEDGSPAQLAGIGIDDEIIAVNGHRVSSAAHAAQLFSAYGSSPVSVTAQTDGTVYTTKVAAIPATSVTIEQMQILTPEQQRNRSFWLSRHRK